MTGEPMLTTSKERMVPELMFSSEQRTPQLSNTTSKVQWPLCFTFIYVQPCYRQKTVEEVPLQQSSHHKNTMISCPQLSITALKVQPPLRFIFSYFQPVTQHYKRKTVLKSSLQLIQSPRKIRTIPFTNVQ